MKYFLIMLSWCTITTFGYAQCISFKGIVLDNTTHEPIEFATVLLSGNPQQESITNELGIFEFKNVCSQPVFIRIRHIGCNDYVDTLQVLDKKVLTFYLDHTANELKEVSIVGQKLEETPIQNLSRIEGRKLFEIQGKSLGDALELVSGVTTLKTGGAISKPMINGFHSNRVLVFTNGVRLESQQWGVEHAPEIDPSTAQRITVFKGPASLRYGSEGFGGTILLEPEPITDSAKLKASTYVNTNSNGRGGMIGGSIEQTNRYFKWLKYRAQASLKGYGNRSSATYYMDNTGNNEYNFSGTAVAQFKQLEVETYYSQFNTSIGIFSGSHVGNVTDLKNILENNLVLTKDTFTYSIQKPYQQITHELAKVKATYHWSDKSLVQLVISRQYNGRSEFDKDRAFNDSIARLNKPALKYELTSFIFDLSNEHVINNKIHGSIGASVLTQKNTYEGRLFIPFYQQLAWGIYSYERYEQKNFELEFGIRFDQRGYEVFRFIKDRVIQTPHQFNLWSASMGAFVELGKHTTATLHTGVNRRSPAINELYSNGLHHGASAIETGNVNLLPETSYSINIGIKSHRHEQWELELNGYGYQIKNYIYLQPSLQPVLTIRGAFPQFNYEQANVLIAGIDEVFRWDLFTHVRYENKAMFVYGYNESIRGGLINLPPARLQQSIGLRGNSWWKFDYPEASIQFNSVAQQTNVPINSDYQLPPKGYHLIGFSISGNIIHKNQRWLIGVYGNNMFNTRYRDYLNRMRYFTDDLGIDIGIKLNWKLD